MIYKDDVPYSANLVDYKPVVLFSPWQREAIELFGLSVWQIFHNSHSIFFLLIIRTIIWT